MYRTVTAGAIHRKATLLATFNIILTLVIEGISTIVRFFLLLLVFVLIINESYTSQTPSILWDLAIWSSWFIAVFPMLLSQATFTLRLSGGWFIPYWSGAREPTTGPHGEYERYQKALNSILSRLEPESRKIFEERKPKYLLVTNDALTIEIKTIGNTLIVSKALFDSPYLEVLLARELYYFGRTPARLRLALERFKLPLLTLIAARLIQASHSAGNGGGSTIGDIRTVGGCLGGLLLFASGGFGEYIISPLWLKYERLSTYLADEITIICHLDSQLYTYLSDKQIHLSEGIGFYAFRATPYPEERIERLLAIKKWYKERYNIFN